MKNIHVDSCETLISYDVSALFTSIPVDKALEVVEVLLNSDDSLKERTYLDSDQVLRLLGFCLRTTYFTFQGDIYKQDGGCDIGSAVSPIIANLYMEHFEQLAITSAPVPPSIWYRYVDDTFVKINRDAVTNFTHHINNIYDNIKFTCDLEKDCQLPFLDTLITKKPNGSIKVSVYRKATHTDQYLDLQSHHPLEHKIIVVRTLMHRVETTVTEPSVLAVEKDLIKSALKNCGYQNWVFSNSDRKSELSLNPTKGSLQVEECILPFPIFRASRISYAELTRKRGHILLSNLTRHFARCL